MKANKKIRTASWIVAIGVATMVVFAAFTYDKPSPPAPSGRTIIEHMVKIQECERKHPPSPETEDSHLEWRDWYFSDAADDFQECLWPKEHAV